MVTWVQKACRGKNLQDMKNALSQHVLVTTRSGKLTNTPQDQDSDVDLDIDVDHEGSESEEDIEETQPLVSGGSLDPPRTAGTPPLATSSPPMTFKFWHDMTPEEQAARKVHKKSTRRTPQSQR